MQEILTKLGVDINVSYHFICLLLVWVRVLAMASVIPFLFGKPVPRYVVVAASMVLAVFVYTQIMPAKPPPFEKDFLTLIMLFVKEVFFGFTIGFAAAIIFHAFAAVGQMIDNQRGTSIARLLIPQLGEQGSISGMFLFLLGIVLYLTAGGHLFFLDSFLSSFAVLPILEFPATGPGLFPMMDLFMRITGEVIYIALQMAAPVIIAIFLADMILGIANRVAPQINVWELGFHIKGYVGVLLLFISLTMIANQIEYYGEEANRHSREVIELLQGHVPEGMPLTPEEGEGGPGDVKEVPKVKQNSKF